MAETKWASDCSTCPKSEGCVDAGAVTDVVANAVVGAVVGAGAVVAACADAGAVWLKTESMPPLTRAHSASKACALVD